MLAEHFGGAGVEMPTTEVYTGLSRGLVDVGWSVYAGGPQAFKWNEVAKYISGPIPGWHCRVLHRGQHENVEFPFPRCSEGDGAGGGGYGRLVQ